MRAARTKMLLQWCWGGQRTSWVSPATVAWFFPGEKRSAQLHDSTQSMMFTCDSYRSRDRLAVIITSWLFQSSCNGVWESDYKEIWAPKNWCLWTVVLEKTLESPSESKEIKPVNPKGNQSWIFIGRTDAEAETPIFGHLIQRTDSLVKTLMLAGRDWRQEENRMTEDEQVGWHHRLYGHEFEQAPGVGDGQGSLVCCSPWGHKESDMTEQLD